MDIFCKIINKEIPSYTIYEDEIVKVILDTNQDAKGHSLIIPKKHYQDLYDIDINTLTHIHKISQKMINLLTEKLNCQGITLIQNNGISQEVKHYHLHIIPIYQKKVKTTTIEETYNTITK